MDANGIDYKSERTDSVNERLAQRLVRRHFKRELKPLFASTASSAPKKKTPTKKGGRREDSDEDQDDAAPFYVEKRCRVLASCTGQLYLVGFTMREVPNPSYRQPSPSAKSPPPKSITRLAVVVFGSFFVTEFFHNALEETGDDTPLLLPIAPCEAASAAGADTGSGGPKVSVLPAALEHLSCVYVPPLVRN